MKIRRFNELKIIWEVKMKEKEESNIGRMLKIIEFQMKKEKERS